MNNKRTIIKLTVILLVITSLACSCPLSGLISGLSIVGTWEGTYEGDDVRMVFESNGDFSIFVAADSETGKYTLDKGTSPHQLDLTYSDGREIFTILEFTDNDTIRMENNTPSGERPTGFSDTITLRRVKP
jgi:hypothetical protein